MGSGMTWAFAFTVVKWQQSRERERQRDKGRKEKRRGEKLIKEKKWRAKRDRKERGATMRELEKQTEERKQEKQRDRRGTKTDGETWEIELRERDERQRSHRESQEMMGEEPMKHRMRNRNGQKHKRNRDQKRDGKWEPDRLGARGGDYEFCVWLLEADGSLSYSELTALPPETASPSCLFPALGSYVKVWCTPVFFHVNNYSWG